jgi:hypothetical protein
MKSSRTAYSYIPSKNISPKVFLGVLLVSFLMQINEGICFAKDLVQARKLLLTGKSTTIRVSFDSHLPIKQPVVGIRFNHLLGPVIWGTNTRRRGAFIDSISGPGHVDINIPELPLLEGTYDLTVALSDHTELLEFDHWERRIRFDVHQHDVFDQGFVTINSTWDVSKS